MKSESAPFRSLFLSAALILSPVGFALCAHRPALLSLRILFLAVLIASLAFLVFRSRSAPDLFALRPLHFSERYAPLALFGTLLLGAALGILYRRALGLSLLPHPFTPFLILTLLIGAAEELLYRGALLSTLRTLPPAVAAGLAALAHGAYKGGLFVFPAASAHYDFLSIGLLTALPGFLIGLLRIRYASLYIPLLGHGIFDLVVYGDSLTTPWWIW